MANFNLLQRTGLYDLNEVCSLFGLKVHELPLSLLHYHAGASLFNRQRSEGGYDIVSVDHRYSQDPQVWRDSIQNILSAAGAEDEVDVLQQRCEEFFDDYEAGFSQGRYQNIHLQQLLSQQLSFGMALCLLDEKDLQSPEKMMESLSLLQQLALEVRVFPIVSQGNNVETLLGPLLVEFQARDCGIELRHTSSLSGESDGAAVLRIWARACGVNS